MCRHGRRARPRSGTRRAARCPCGGLRGGRFVGHLRFPRDRHARHSVEGRVLARYVPGIHVLLPTEVRKTWMAGTSPAMTRAVFSLPSRSGARQRAHLFRAPRLEMCGFASGTCAKSAPAPGRCRDDDRLRSSQICSSKRKSAPARSGFFAARRSARLRQMAAEFVGVSRHGHDLGGTDRGRHDLSGAGAVRHAARHRDANGSSDATLLRAAHDAEAAAVRDHRHQTVSYLDAARAIFRSSAGALQLSPRGPVAC